MNLHGIASGLIGVINPFITATVAQSTGYTPAPDGKRTPTYAPGVSILCQVQSLTYNDLTMLENLNIQGVRRAIYVNAGVQAMIRIARRGGDLIVFPKGMLPEGDVWLAAQVLEAWPDWAKIALTLQDGA